MQDTYLIGLFYSPTTADSVVFDNFNANIEKASEISSNLILVGDLNEDLLNMNLFYLFIYLLEIL